MVRLGNEMFDTCVVDITLEDDIDIDDTYDYPRVHSVERNCECFFDWSSRGLCGPFI